MISIKIAVYGKGGIGKSTISANVSAAFAKNGHSVLQIGCDPKHDSTRLLLGGKIPVTALDYIRDILPADRNPEDIIYKGYGNVACVEAGGPKPGVGCAGRGIISTFELLEELGIKSSLFDITLYDVLGDVVCGGFSVPIRREYADAIYIVTSGEFMAIYAANNILRGIRQFTETKNRVAGIIYNARGLLEEDERVARFSKAVKLPVIVSVPRSEIFADAEKDGCTLIEKYPDSDEAGLFCKLAEHMKNLESEKGFLYPALPLSDEELENTVLMRNEKIPADKFRLSEIRVMEKKCISNSVKNKKPLIGCAFAGAVSVTAQITDAMTVMHCPKSCALMIYEKMLDTSQSSTARYNDMYSGGMPQRMITTDMTDDDFIFGGEKKLEDALEDSIDKGFKTIFVITACPPGIIGDNIKKVISSVCEKNPDICIIPIETDGNLTGDFAQGEMDAYRALTCLINKEVSKKESRSVNIIAEKYLASNADNNIQAVKDLLNKLDISVNCRFLIRSNMDSIRKFNEAALNLPAYSDETSENIQKIISSVSDVPFFEKTLPTGFRETKEWLLSIAEIFERQDVALRVIAEEEKEYQKRVDALKPVLKGKNVLISTYPKSVDWIFDIASDLGMNILKVGLTYSPFSEDLPSCRSHPFPVEKNYSVEMRSDDIKILNPDFILHTYPSLKPSDEVKSAGIPYCPGFGFSAALAHAERWTKLISYPLSEGWKRDGEGII